MGAVSWFIGAALFLILVVTFTGAMGQEIASADVGSGNIDPELNLNSSNDFDSSTVRDSVSFVGGLAISWSEAPVIISSLLLLPLIILGLTGYLIIVRGAS